MKKLESLGKKLSRDEAKKIQGGCPRMLYWCYEGVPLVCWCAENQCPGMCSGNCNSVQEGPETCASICSS